MNYKRIYDQLIEKRKLNILSRDKCYCEEHHIKPVSFGGSNDKDNRVMLTAKEHYIAHHLLQKFCMHEFGINSWQYKAMTTAMHFLANTRKEQIHLTAKQYNSVRQKFAEIQKKRMAGKHNPCYGKKWMYNPNKDQFIFVKKEECEQYLKNGYIFRSHSFGKKMTAQQRATISKNHADVSGKNNPMYGHPCTDFMSSEKAKQWRENLKKRDLTGENNGAYGKKWIRNKITDEQLYVLENDAKTYIATGNWEYGISKKHISKMINSLTSEKTQMKNLKTRFPNIDFSDFDYSYYRTLSKDQRYVFRQQYFATHTI